MQPYPTMPKVKSYRTQKCILRRVSLSPSFHTSLLFLFLLSQKILEGVLLFFVYKGYGSNSTENIGYLKNKTKANRKTTDWKTKIQKEEQKQNKTQNIQNWAGFDWLLFAFFLFLVFVVFFWWIFISGCFLVILCFDYVFLFLNICLNQLSLLKPVSDYKGKWTEFVCIQPDLTCRTPVWLKTAFAVLVQEGGVLVHGWCAGKGK